ncbi:reverse transcriptase domain-containing protein [Acinetobacter radioresistens]|uniref:reverse transcriptase domain-containing protein n=1 Tax=Acinetobacter radioresistens TaxID=40216 RepID=UPI0032146F92
MSLEKILRDEILIECEKLINRYHSYHNSLSSEYSRSLKRSIIVKKKVVKRPEYWSTNKGCDPFYVKKNINAIAKSVTKKISERSYKPFKTSILKVPKDDGNTRTVVIYQIADAVVSKIFYQRLLAKNKHRFSSFAYAYRNDRNVHFAIQDISIDIHRNDRSFVAEFDFSDFFGNISHEYLFKQFDKNGFIISDEEKFIIEAFLDLSKGKGIPQGTSISLFLANLACWQLDYKLEKEGLKFARYADDTLIWSTDYQKICNSFNIMTAFSRSAGIPINAKKSEGISLLQKAEYRKSEFTPESTKSFVDFLGYSVSVDNISFRNKTILNIKKQISYLLYKNLIQPLIKNNFRIYTRIEKEKDYNLAVSLMQIKRYMYGNLNNKQLVNYITGRSKRLHFKGIMSFYPLVNDIKQLEDLDGWLISTIHRCIKLREKLLVQNQYIRPNMYSFSLNKKILLKQLNKSNYYEIPSFKLILEALQKGIKNNGLPNIIRYDTYNYNY